VTTNSHWMMQSVIQLALDADRLIPGEEQVCGEMQTLLGNVHDLTEGGGMFFRHEAAPRNRHAEMSALGRHQSILLIPSEGNSRIEAVKRPLWGPVLASGRPGLQRREWEREPDLEVSSIPKVTCWDSFLRRACPRTLQCQGQRNTYKAGHPK
jgi:hypothetical protein